MQDRDSSAGGKGVGGQIAPQDKAAEGPPRGNVDGFDEAPAGRQAPSGQLIDWRILLRQLVPGPQRAGGRRILARGPQQGGWSDREEPVARRLEHREQQEQAHDVNLEFTAERSYDDSRDA